MRDGVNSASVLSGAVLFSALSWGLDQNVISACLFSFFFVAFVRKLALDASLACASA